MEPAPRSQHRDRPLRWSAAAHGDADPRLHDDTLRTDSGGTARSGAPRFAACRIGGVGNSWRDASGIAPAATRRGEAPDDLPAPVRRQRWASRLVRAGAERVRTLEGNQAHGRNGRQGAGNGVGLQRIRRRSKAVKSAVQSGRHWLWRLATGVPGGAIRPAEWQRQDGKGRSDAARLSTRGTLRRV